MSAQGDVFKLARDYRDDMTDYYGSLVLSDTARLARALLVTEEALKAYRAIFIAWEGKESLALNEEALRQWKSIADLALAGEQNTGTEPK